MTPAGHAKTFDMLRAFIEGVDRLAEELTPVERGTVARFLHSVGTVIDDDTARLRTSRPETPTLSPPPARPVRRATRPPRTP